MDGNKRNLSLIVVAVAIGVLYFAVTELMGAEETVSEAASSQTEAGAAADADGATDDDGEPQAGQPGQAVRPERESATITTEHYTATIDSWGGGIRSFLITGDPRFTDAEGRPLDVTSLPEGRGTNTEAFPQYETLRVHLAEIGMPADTTWRLRQIDERTVELVWEGQDVRITRTLSAGRGPYQIWATTRIQNLANHERGTRLEMEAWLYVARDDESGGIVASRSPYISQGTCVFGEDETERKDHDKLVEDGLHGYGNGDVHIAAVDNVYFAQALAAHGAPAARCGLEATNIPSGAEDPHGSLFRSRLIYPWVTIEGGGEVSYQTLAYLGPKDADALNLAGHHLPEMIDLGFFALIARQLARLLSFLHQYVPNWGLAIILLTLMIRLTLFPLTNLSFKSMARMRQLKPEIDRINELYKDDAEKKGAAVMELYRKHKINPLSGCLPSLVQLPVWWALYTSLSTNIELYHMPFALWWTDLSSPDTYYVLPIMLGALMHLQQRLSPTTMDPTQAKMMMYFMPIMITVFMLFLPSGLCLYMLTNSALGIAQQKFNEYRLAQQATALADADDASGDDEDDAEDSDEDDDKRSQKRRPRRKRRVRRGRA